MLLFHWSMLNYAALVKILKKHGAHHLIMFSCLRQHSHAIVTVGTVFIASHWLHVSAMLP